MRVFKTILWMAGALVYAVVFAGLFELSRRTAYVWSFLDEKASLRQAAGRIVSGDTKMIGIALAAGLVLGLMSVLLATTVRAYWTIRARSSRPDASVVSRKNAAGSSEETREADGEAPSEAQQAGGEAPSEAQRAGGGVPSETREAGAKPRSFRISALAVMLLINALALVCLGADAFVQRRRYEREKTQIEDIRSMLAQDQRIYHAGGGIAGPDGMIYNYTNSLEAFQQSLDHGVRFVELDFRFTTDGELVCIHKWKKDFVKADGTPAEGEVSLEEFLQGKIQGYFTPMTVEDVAAAMREHPQLHIVVDLKGDDVIRGYKILADRYPDLMPRLIPQFYHATQFDYLYGLGYRAMIFTLYRTGEWERSESALNAFAMRQMLVGITFGIYRLEDGGAFLRQVLNTRQPVYIHTVDDPVRQQELFDAGVSAVYTNILS